MKIYLTQKKDGTYGVEYNKIKEIALKNFKRIFSDEKAEEEVKKLEEIDKKTGEELLTTYARKNILLADLEKEDLLYFVNNNVTISDEFELELERNFNLVEVNNLNSLEDLKALYFLVKEENIPYKYKEFQKKIFENKEEEIIVIKKLLTKKEYENFL